MGGQRGLFDAPPAAEQVLIEDQGRDCRVRYWERYLYPREAGELLAGLLAMAPLEPETVVVAGRSMLTRRKSCAFGEPGLVYRYVGAVRPANPWPLELLSVLERIRTTCGCRFDFALAGLYPDGEADLGWHSDDETDLEPGAPIGSLSLGAERDFKIRAEFDGGKSITQPLAHGSLLTMEGATQRWFKHSVPARAGVSSPRLNLTFRLMRRHR